MTRTFVPAALLAAALTTPPASADPIVITGGT
jgi:hypothetical protein